MSKGRRNVISFRRCLSCNDKLNVIPDDVPPEVQVAMRARCKPCALEVLGLKLPEASTLQHDTGGGRRIIRESKTH